MEKKFPCHDKDDLRKVLMNFYDRIWHFGIC